MLRWASAMGASVFLYLHGWGHWTMLGGHWLYGVIFQTVFMQIIRLGIVDSEEVRIVRTVVMLRDGCSDRPAPDSQQFTTTAVDFYGRQNVY